MYVSDDQDAKKWISERVVLKPEDMKQRFPIARKFSVYKFYRAAGLQIEHYMCFYFK